MRTLSLTFALLTAGFVLAGPAYAEAPAGATNALSSQPGIRLDAGANIRLACSRATCVAFCSDRYGTEKTNCMRTCSKRRENCN
jgi:hypothetical protein